MTALTDFHSHILPGIDDGSRSVEESVAMLRMEAAQGITAVVATPHFYPRYESPETFLAKRERAEKQLRAAMAPEPGLPRLLVGAEVYFYRGISDSEFLPRMSIQGTRYLLIEMPPSPWQDAVYRELAQIREKRNLIPVIAHIDRYIAPFHTHGIPRNLEQLPVLVQANADFFLVRSTRRMAMKMLRTGQIHLLGSDCHNLTSRRPNLGDAAQRIRRKLGREVWEMIETYQAEVLEMQEMRNGVLL